MFILCKEWTHPDTLKQMKSLRLQEEESPAFIQKDLSWAWKIKIIKKDTSIYNISNLRFETSVVWLRSRVHEFTSLLKGGLSEMWGGASLPENSWCEAKELHRLKVFTRRGNIWKTVSSDVGRRPDQWWEELSHNDLINVPTTTNRQRWITSWKNSYWGFKGVHSISQKV